MSDNRWVKLFMDSAFDFFEELIPYISAILILAIIGRTMKLLGIAETRAGILEFIHFIFSCIFMVFFGCSTLWRRIKRNFLA